jgi:hypothetical protein
MTENPTTQVDRAVEVSDQNLASVQNRSARLEELVRDSELASRTTATALRDELLERVRELSGEWLADRATVDRRLAVGEKVADDCLERLRLSGSLIDNYFLSSPEIKRFQRTAEGFDALQNDVLSAKTEIREYSGALHKLQANASTKGELMDLREKVTATFLFANTRRQFQQEAAFALYPCSLRLLYQYYPRYTHSLFCV